MQEGVSPDPSAKNSQFAGLLPSSAAAGRKLGARDTAGNRMEAASMSGRGRPVAKVTSKCGVSGKLPPGAELLPLLNACTPSVPIPEPSSKTRTAGRFVDREAETFLTNCSGSPTILSVLLQPIQYPQRGPSCLNS